YQYCFPAWPRAGFAMADRRFRRCEPLPRTAPRRRLQRHLVRWPRRGDAEKRIAKAVVLRAVIGVSALFQRVGDLLHQVLHDEALLGPDVDGGAALSQIVVTYRPICRDTSSLKPTCQFNF